MRFIFWQCQFATPASRFVFMNWNNIIWCITVKKKIVRYGKNIQKPAEDTYPQKIFSHQLITVDDLFQFKKELVQELLTALKAQSNASPKKWMKAHEVRRLLKVLRALCRPWNHPASCHTPGWAAFTSSITRILKTSFSPVRLALIASRHNL